MRKNIYLTCVAVLFGMANGATAVAAESNIGRCLLVQLTPLNANLAISKSAVVQKGVFATIRPNSETFLRIIKEDEKNAIVGTIAYSRENQTVEFSVERTSCCNSDGEWVQSSAKMIHVPFPGSLLFEYEKYSFMAMCTEN